MKFGITYSSARLCCIDAESIVFHVETEDYYKQTHISKYDTSNDLGFKSVDMLIK